MQYNIFRIKDKDGLFKEMINNNYIKSKVEKSSWWLLFKFVL